MEWEVVFKFVLGGEYDILTTEGTYLCVPANGSMLFIFAESANGPAVVVVAVVVEVVVV